MCFFWLYNIQGICSFRSLMIMAIIKHILATYMEWVQKKKTRTNLHNKIYMNGRLSIIFHSEPQN